MYLRNLVFFFYFLLFFLLNFDLCVNLGVSKIWTTGIQNLCVLFLFRLGFSAIQASGLCFKLLQRPEHFMREARDATLSATESSRRTSCVAWDASVVLAGLTSVGTGSQPPAEHLAPEDKAEDSELGDRKLSLLPFFIVLHCLIGQNHLSFHFGFEDAVPWRTKASQHSKFKPIFSFQTFFFWILTRIWPIDNMRGILIGQNLSILAFFGERYRGLLRWFLRICQAFWCRPKQRMVAPQPHCGIVGRL